MRDRARFEQLESSQWELRDKLQALSGFVPDEHQPLFTQAGRGLDYAFKSQLLAERVLTILWERIWEEGRDGDYIVMPTPTSRQLPDIQGFLTEATFRALHAAADLLAQVLSQALLPDPLPVDDCSLELVRRQLVQVSRCQPVVEAVDRLRGSSDSAYVNAFANYCKHQGYVEREHVTEFGESIKTGTALAGFIYEGKRYPRKSFQQLELMTTRLHRLYVHVVEAALDCHA